LLYRLRIRLFLCNPNYYLSESAEAQGYAFFNELESWRERLNQTDLEKLKRMEDEFLRLDEVLGFNTKQQLEKYLATPARNAVSTYFDVSPAEFENVVARLLVALGYRDVRVVGGAGDLAADIVCVNPDGECIVVQCKRYAPTRKVRSAEMQAFIGMIAVHHQADGGIFVTTSRFTEAATSLAIRHGIEMIDGRMLSELGTASHGTSDGP
jgi:restriction endonuclease Mrr